MSACRPAGLRTREYGAGRSVVVLLHGGPGAGGYLSPLARELAGPFHVLEPLQRRSGGAPLTVATHVSDLHALVREACGEAPPALVGHSWGAMLALAFAAAHPGSVRSLALIGCGTFDPAAREALRAAFESRLEEGLRRRLARLPEECPDPDARLRALGNLTLAPYSHDPVVSALELELCDARGHDETWQDMLRLQQAGVYPSAFEAIRVPVLMLHGQVDPHPGGRTRDTLRRHLPQLEYSEWPRCGHSPWLERAVREEFVAALRAWLSGGGPPAA